jgi:plastocyanin
MDTKTKIHIIISIVLVSLITILTYWIQLPSKDLKAQVIDTDTVLVRMQDFTFDPDIVRIDTNTTVTWLHDESEDNADVLHTVISFDPEDPDASGDIFESDVMSLGETFSYTFNTPGVYYYNCSLYPIIMTGKVCVGDESEVLDEDCSIDPTEADETIPATTEEDLLGDEEEDLLEEDLAPAADEDFVLDEDITLLEEEEEEEDVIDMTPVQPTDLAEPTEPTGPSDTAVIDYSGAEADVLTGPAASASKDGAELSDSGPEDLLYIFVLLFALYTAKKLHGDKA